MHGSAVKIWILLLQLKLCFFIYWLIEQLVWLSQCSGKATGRTTKTSDVNPQHIILFCFTSRLALGTIHSFIPWVSMWETSKN